MTIKKLEKRVYRLGCSRDCTLLYQWIHSILWEANRKGMHMGKLLVVRRKGNKRSEYCLDPSWFTVRLTKKPASNDDVLLRLSDLNLRAISNHGDDSQDTFMRDADGNYIKDEYGNFLLRNIYTETMYRDAINKAAYLLYEDALK